MKLVLLTQNKSAIVDDEDFEILSAARWNARRLVNTFYAGRMINMPGGKRRTLLMHHAIIGRPPRGMEVDHIDGNGLNNQKSNLRFVTRRQNMQNALNSRIKRTSKYPGVSYDSRRGKWKSYIKLAGKHIDLGRFKSENDAFMAYKKSVEAIGESVIDRGAQA